MATKFRVFLDGKEVTHLCQVADTRLGIVLLLKVDESNQFYVDPVSQEAAKEWKRGRVTLTRKLRLRP